MRHLSTAERIGYREGMLSALLVLGNKRFGPPDDKTKATLERITSIRTLEKLALRLLEVEDWQELLKRQERL